MNNTHNHNHTLQPESEWANIHKSQKGKNGRHQCALCAYNAGYEDGLNSRGQQYQVQRPDDFLSNLPNSQAKPARHKCCVCAYHLGFAAGHASELPIT